MPSKSQKNLSFCFSLFSGARKKLRKQWLIVKEDIMVRQGDQLLFIAPQCHDKEGDATGPYKAQYRV
jgi:hypothetical protein